MGLFLDGIRRARDPAIYSGAWACWLETNLKEASDLGAPLVGVGLMYAEGYFSSGFPRTAGRRRLITCSVLRTCRSCRFWMAARTR